jgi:hypothetical protein
MSSENLMFFHFFLFPVVPQNVGGQATEGIVEELVSEHQGATEGRIWVWFRQRVRQGWVEDSADDAVC